MLITSYTMCFSPPPIAVAPPLPQVNTCCVTYILIAVLLPPTLTTASPALPSPLLNTVSPALLRFN